MRDGEGSWCTGPAGDRRRYRVADPTPLAGGQNYVFEGWGPDGRVALKIVETAAGEQSRRRTLITRLTEQPHPRLRVPSERFRGPGLFQGEPPPDEECDLLVIACPWIEGQTLRAAGAMAPADALVVIDDVVDAVEHLHALGYLHRDIHPGNLIVDADGRATIIDLGAVREDDGAHTATVAGVLGFIPPELTHSPGDRRSDRWAVGMVAVFTLVGHPQGDRSVAQLEEELRWALAGTGHPAKAAAHICRLVDRDPAARPTDLRAWAGELRALVETRRRRHGVAAVAAAAVGVAGLAAGVVFVAASDGDGGEAAEATTATTATATVEVAGAGSPRSGPEATFTPATCGEDFGVPAEGVDPALVADAVDALVAGADGGCAIGPVELFGEALVQPVGINGPDGVVVLGPGGHAVRLTNVQYESWRQIAGMDDQLNAIRFGGYPVSVRTDEVPGTVAVRLSFNGWVIGSRTDTQSFWVPDQVRAVWDREGGVEGRLGLPMSNVYLAADGLRYDFEGGYLHVPSSDRPVEETRASDIEVVYVDDRAAPLRELGDLTGRIVRQVTGTAWWVDEQGRRRWIPDGGVWECLGGDANVAIRSAPGWAVATLPLGEPAVCPP